MSDNKEIKTETYEGPERRKSMYDRMADVEKAVIQQAADNRSQRLHNYGLYFAVLILVGIILAVYSKDHSDNNRTTDAIAADEHATCVVQARGLPAGHKLAAGLGDIVRFLQVVLPPGVIATPLQQNLFQGIEDNLGSYARAESKQPATRTCTTTKKSGNTTTTLSVTTTMVGTSTNPTITTQKKVNK